MTTEAAQRRLLEALAELDQAPGIESGDALASFALGVNEAMEFAVAVGQPGVARVFANLISLAFAVRDDQKEPTK